MKIKYLIYPSLWVQIKGLFKGVLYIPVYKCRYDTADAVGAYEEGDGGGGAFYFDGPPTEVNGGEVIKMYGTANRGRWVKQP